MSLEDRFYCSIYGANTEEREDAREEESFLRWKGLTMPLEYDD